MIINEIGRNIDIYLAVGFTDMRKSIDGLAAIVQQRFQLNPMSKALVLCQDFGQLKYKNFQFLGELK